MEGLTLAEGVNGGVMGGCGAWEAEREREMGLICKKKLFLNKI